jgi:hypothetical protein
MSTLKFSVITVSYNQGEFIRQNIESVLAQEYPHFEHIVVDGGSTDGTVEILKSYPHLLWTSEKDRGQSHALNKGFSRATGDIIAWLNSDDWYAPKVFHEIAVALRDADVVLGHAEKTDRAGISNELIRNTPRSYYDLWRYWVPYAWLAQPSVFFTRKALEAARRFDGSYVDEDLYFTMDYDLWMRLARPAPLYKQIPRTLSYFRMYEENKTGAWPLATQRECARVFRRHQNRGEECEHRISVAIPVTVPSEELKRTIIALTAQSNRDFEIVLLGYGDNQSEKKEAKNFSLTLSEIVEHSIIRYVDSHTTSFDACAMSARDYVRSPIVSLLAPGDTVTPQFIHTVLDYFSRDVTGLLLHVRPEVAASFYPDGKTLNVAAPLLMPPEFPRFSARRQALREIVCNASLSHPRALLRYTLISLMFKNWWVGCDTSANITTCEDRASGTLAPWSDSDTFAVIRTLQQECAADPFFAIRKAMRDPAPLFALLSKH